MRKDNDGLVAIGPVVVSPETPARKSRKRVSKPSLPTTPPILYKSALEVRPTGQIRGWVYNPADPSEKASVRLFIDDVEIARTIADQDEPKLNLDDKNHRFWLVIPDRFHDGESHAYRVEIGETGMAVRQPDPAFLLARKERAEILQVSGSVAFKSGSLRGHARDTREPRDKHVVNLFVDGRFVGAALADEDRPDVEDSRQGHFFSFPIPMHYWDGLPHGFRAMVDGSETPIEQIRETFAIPIPSGVTGEVEGVLNGAVTGWATDMADPGRPVDAMVRIDGVVETRVKSDIAYPPLKLANGVTVARMGFSIPLADRFFDGQEHEFIVHLGDKTLSARSLCGRSFQLSRPVDRDVATRLSIEAERKSFKETEVLYDIVFVLNINSKGWILEKICRTISDQLGLNAHFTFTERNSAVSGWLPRARAYFFGHYKLLAGALKSGADIGDAARFVWFTHPVFDTGFTRDDLYTTLSAADHIFTANTRHREALAFLGLPPKSVTTVLGGADPDDFKFKLRTGRGVGVVGAYYRRKNPDLMLALAKAMPDTPFLLLAPTASEVENKQLLWTHWPRIDEFRALPNTRYVEAAYVDFPTYFEEFDIYLSVSDLEGGPIPLIEAMFSNCFPVVTRTGFAEDVVVDGVNGYLVPIDVGVEALAEKVRMAGRNQSDVRATVGDYTWNGFGSAIAAFIAPPTRNGRTIALGLGHGSEMRLREGWSRQDALGAICNGDLSRISLPLTEPLSSVALCIEGEPGAGPTKVELAIDRSPIATRTVEPGVQWLRFDLPATRPATTVMCNITLAVRTQDVDGTAAVKPAKICVRSITLNGAAA